MKPVAGLRCRHPLSGYFHVWRITAYGINQNQQAMSLPIDRKMLLSIREAAEYSNIGINKIDEMLKQPNCPFVLYVGTKKLVKRKAFEEFIEARVAI